MRSKIYGISMLFMAIAMLFIVSCKKYSINDADKAKRTRQYAQAAIIYTAVSANPKETKENKERAQREAAECYRLAEDFKKAQKAYEKVLKKDPKNPDALYQLGVIHMKNASESGKVEEYRTARNYFSEYLKEVPNDPIALKRLASCDSAESWLSQPSRFKVTEFKEANTKQNDYAPMISSKKDDELMFTSDREGGVNKKPYWWSGFWFSDVWTIKKEGKRGKQKWGKPVLITGEVNDKMNEGTVTFDRRFSEMYFTRCNGTDGKSMYCKIYSATKRSADWTTVTMLDFCNDTFNYGHPALDETGLTLYFSSDMPGGYGGYDIWKVTYVKRAKSWSTPVNLGPTINTEKNEQFPYWNPHDKKLYFSSNGHIGMGGMDIYRSASLGENDWEEPENLRYPLNTGADDITITFDIGNENHGFFASNRKGGRGGYDIYEFNVEPLVFTLSGQITDCNGKQILPGATVKITNNKDTATIILKADATGSYGPVKLNPETKYEISAHYNEKYYFPSESFQQSTVGLKFSKDLKQDICLNSMIDFKTVLPIFYDLDKAIIRPDAKLVLDNFINTFLSKYPKIRIELGSHTDCRSSYEYNMDLSRRRADSAVAYLVSRGIDARRIVAKGYGESELTNDCKCEGGEVSGYTKYDLGIKDDKGNPLYAQKQIITRDANGNQVISYRNYEPSEIKTINGVKMVACDEYQHSQNRRTTIKIIDVDFDPRMKVKDSPDSLRNTNKGTNTNKEAIKEGPINSTQGTDTSTVATPSVPDSSFIKIKISESNGVKMISVRVNDMEDFQWAYDLSSSKNEVTEEFLIELLEKKIISKKDFLDGEPIKLSNGMKIPSNTFKINIMIGDELIEGVSIKFNPKADKSVLGKLAFKAFMLDQAKEMDGHLYLKPKKKKPTR